MKVEFFEEEVTGRAATVTKLFVKKTVGPEYIVTRTATNQDKVEFKAELEMFIAGKAKPSKKAAKKEEVKEEETETGE